jgi:putative addiction module component (TIGR02574 family)
MIGIREIEQTVMSLPVQQRVLLAETLLDSLSPAGGEGLGDNWDIAEVERREREIATGQTQPLNEAEFKRRIEEARSR